MATFSQRFRGAISAVGVGVKASARELDAVTPQVTSGAGVPSEALPDGSVYLRTDAATAATALYSRIAGAWVAIDGMP
jgi:hypothetical protein